MLHIEQQTRDAAVEVMSAAGGKGKRYGEKAGYMAGVSRHAWQRKEQLSMVDMSCELRLSEVCAVSSN